MRELTTNLRTYANSIQRAAIEDQIGQAEASANIDSAFEHLNEALDDFRVGMCGTVGESDDCDWSAITDRMSASINDAYNACKAETVDSLWDYLTVAASFCPYISDGVGAFNSFKGLFQEGMDGKKTFGVLIPKDPWEIQNSLGELERVSHALGYVKSAAKGFRYGSQALDPILRLSGVINDGSKCDRSNSNYRDALALLATVITQKAIIDGFAVQAETIEGILQSISSTLSYQVANEEAAASLQDSANAAVIEMNEISLDENDLANPIKRAEAIDKSCHVLRTSTHTAEAEVVGFAQRLQTSAGWPTTTALAVVPADLDTDSTVVPFIDSLWDVDLVGDWFDGAADGSPSIAQVAGSRFVSLVDTMCNTYSSDDAAPMTFMYVKKRITGEALTQFKDHGFVRFSVGLSDLVDTDETFANTAYGLSATGYRSWADHLWYDVSAPVVYGVGYSGCWGAESEPCCDDEVTCRSPLAELNPFIVRHENAAIPSLDGCDDVSDWELSEQPMDLGRTGGSKWEVRTCMQKVHTSPLVAQIDPVGQGAIENASILYDPTRDALCELSAPANLLLGGLRGSPLFGSWSLAYNEEMADKLRRHKVDEVNGVCDETDPDSCEGLENVTIEPEWASQNSDLGGIEVFLIVAVEPLSDGRVSPYQTSLYRNDEWRQGYFEE